MIIWVISLKKSENELRIDPMTIEEYNKLIEDEDTKVFNVHSKWDKAWSAFMRANYETEFKHQPIISNGKGE